MTEPRTTDAFEGQFAERVRGYTAQAVNRRVDALAIARTAMSSRRAPGWAVRRLTAGSFGRRSAFAWATAFVAVVLVGVAVMAVQRRPPDVVGGPVPDVLRHAWERPYTVAPGSSP